MGTKQSKNLNGTSADSSITQQKSDRFVDPIVREPVTCLDSTNGDLCYGSQSGEIEILDLQADSKSKGSWKIHDKAICKMCICSSNDMCFTASRDKTLAGRNLYSTEGKKFAGHTLAVTGVACNQDGSRIMSGGRDCTVALWDVNSATEIKREDIARNLVTDIKWNSRENLAVQCSEDKIMKLWDTRALEKTGSFPIKQYFQNCCDFAIDGIHIVSGSVGGNGNGCELIVWDVRKMEQVSLMKGHTQNITSCVFYGTTENQRIITTSNDCSVRVWDPVRQVSTCTYYISGAEALTSSVVMENGSIYVGSLQGGIHELVYNSANESLYYVSVF